MILLAALVLIIGVSLGATGYGGFIIPILLVVITGTDSRSAVAVGLISFLPSGIAGTLLHWRHGSRPNWMIVALICAGALPGIWIGRVVSHALPEVLLRVLVAALVAAAGLSLFIRRLGTGLVARRRREVVAALETDDRITRDRQQHVAAHRDRGGLPQRRVTILLTLFSGVLAGTASVIAGVGGPLITVPILLALRLKPGPVVAAALASSIFSAALGAAALGSLIDLDRSTLAIITAAQLAGIPVGVWLHRRIGDRLEPVVAIMAIASSLWLLWAALARFTDAGHLS